MRRALELTALALAVAFVGIQFVRPARTNPGSDPAKALSGAEPTAIAAIMDRSCRDCHSNDTRWPWYSNVAPISWFVIDHVDHGRSHFNYSDWAGYDRGRQASLREGSCELARRGAMPMPSYLRMHRAARLAPADIEVLCAWARPTPAH